MSSTYLRLIPADPTFVPKATARQQARDLPASFVPEAWQVSATATEEVEFVDPGANFVNLSCPACGAVLWDDWRPAPWWYEAMDRAHQAHFRDLIVTMPCCGARCSLNDLHYDWPAGFARFVLEAVDPWVNPWTDVTEVMIATLEHVLGCKLKRIVARY